MKKIALFLGIFLALPAKAVCPVCTVAVGAGVGFSRWLGIDDSVAGLWVGALLMSVTMWTINWLTKKNIKFIGRKPLVLIAYYALAIIPLYSTGVMGHPANTLWNIDKILLGTIIGSIAFLWGELWYESLKKKNGGRAHFPMQKVAMPVAILLFLSFAFYVITV